MLAAVEVVESGAAAETELSADSMTRKRMIALIKPDVARCCLVPSSLSPFADALCVSQCLCASLSVCLNVCHCVSHCLSASLCASLMACVCLTVCPDSNENVVGEILNTLRLRGFQVLQLKTMQMTWEEAASFYSPAQHQRWFMDLVNFISSGVVIAMELEAEDALRLWR